MSHHLRVLPRTKKTGIRTSTLLTLDTFFQQVRSHQQTITTAHRRVKQSLEVFQAVDGIGGLPQAEALAQAVKQFHEQVTLLTTFLEGTKRLPYAARPHLSSVLISLAMLRWHTTRVLDTLAIFSRHYVLSPPPSLYRKIEMHTAGLLNEFGDFAPTMQHMFDRTLFFEREREAL